MRSEGPCNGVGPSMTLIPCLIRWKLTFTCSTSYYSELMLFLLNLFPRPSNSWFTRTLGDHSKLAESGDISWTSEVILSPKYAGDTQLFAGRKAASLEGYTKWVGGVPGVGVGPLPDPEDAEATARWVAALGNMWEDVGEDVGGPDEGGLFLGGDSTDFGDPFLVSPTRAPFIPMMAVGGEEY